MPSLSKRLVLSLAVSRPNNRPNCHGTTAANPRLLGQTQHRFGPTNDTAIGKGSDAEAMRPRPRSSLVMLRSRVSHVMPLQRVVMFSICSCCNQAEMSGFLQSRIVTCRPVL